MNPSGGITRCKGRPQFYEIPCQVLPPQNELNIQYKIMGWVIVILDFMKLNIDEKKQGVAQDGQICPTPQ